MVTDPAAPPQEPGAPPEQTSAAPVAPVAPVSRPPTTLAARLVALVEVLLCSGFPTQLALILLFGAAGWTPADEAGRLSATYVLALTLLDAALVVGLTVLFLTRDGESPRSVFFGRRWPVVEARLGVLLVPIMFVGIVLVIGSLRVWVPSLHNVERNPLQDLLAGPWRAAVFMTLVVVAGGVREEVQRAFILHRFDRYLGGGGVGLVLFSLAFGAGHLDQGRDVAVATACLGLFWGWLYLRRRSIVAPLVNHVGFNLGQAAQFLMLRA